MSLVVTYYPNGKIEMVFSNKTNETESFKNHQSSSDTQPETKTFTNASTQTDSILFHIPETLPSPFMSFRHCNIPCSYVPLAEPPRRNKLCRYWQNDNCRYPDEICKHAHGRQLLGTRMSEFWRHKERCQRWRHGYCPFNNDECFYLHG